MYNVDPCKFNKLFPGIFKHFDNVETLFEVFEKMPLGKINNDKDLELELTKSLDYFFQTSNDIFLILLIYYIRVDLSNFSRSLPKLKKDLLKCIVKVKDKS